MLHVKTDLEAQLSIFLPLREFCWAGLITLYYKRWLLLHQFFCPPGYIKFQLTILNSQGNKNKYFFLDTIINEQ